MEKYSFILHARQWEKCNHKNIIRGKWNHPLTTNHLINQITCGTRPRIFEREATTHY